MRKQRLGDTTTTNTGSFRANKYHKIKACKLWEFLEWI